MPRICPNTDEEIVDVVLSVGEEISDTTLLPYQTPFASRMVDSTLKGDADTITALFSRQCLHKSTLILTPTGLVPIGKLKKGDIVVSRNDSNQMCLDKVEEIWHTEEQALWEVGFEGSKSIKCTADHRFRSMQRKEWVSVSADTLKKHELLQTPLVPVANTPWSFGVDKPFKRDSEVTKDDIELALMLQFAKDSESSLVSRLLSPSAWARYYFRENAISTAESLGLDTDYVSEAGKFFQVQLKQKKYENLFELAFSRRESILKALFKEFQVRPYIDNRKVRRFQVELEIGSTGQYLDTLLEVLWMMGISPKVNEDKTRLLFKDFQSVFLLQPFLKHHYMYKELHNYITEYLNWTGAQISPEDFNDVIERAPIVAQYLDQNKSHSQLWRYKNEGIVLSTLIQAIRAVCPDRLVELLPRVCYRRVKSLKRAGADRLVDMTTRDTGVYIAAGIVTHNSGKSEALTVAIVGLLLWLPALAKEYPDDPRFKKFRKGFWIGVFAPIIKQALNVYNRVRRRLKSERGKKFLYELGLTFDVDQSKIFELSNGSKLVAAPGGEEANIESETFHLVIGDEAQDISSFKWKKSIVPMCTMTGGSKVLVGTSNTVKSHFYDSIEKNRSNQEKRIGAQNHFENDYRVASKYIPEYRISVQKAIEEMGYDSDEFQMAYCNKFIFARGMVFESEMLDEYDATNNPKGLLRPYEASDVYTGKNPVVIGIDIGKTVDPTVMTAMEVDIANPVDVLYFRTFHKKVIGWKEIKGDAIAEQIDKMIAYIIAMKADTIIMDTTGKGESYFDLLKAKIEGFNNKTLIPFLFTQRSKSDMYKALLSDLSTGRIQVPSGKRTRETPEFFKFIKECSELEKEYRGQYLSCRAPKVRNAHDDYPTSLALAAWACKDYYLGAVEITENPFFRGRRRR